MVNFFRHIITSTWKETLLLRRDRAGLLVLFFMPAALVVIITLVQENVMELTGEKNSEILFYDQDKGLVGERIRKAFENSDRISLVDLEVGVTTREEAVSLVNSGDFQVLVVVPEDTSIRLEQNARALFEETDGADDSLRVGSLPVFFDPGLLPGFRSGILAVLKVTLFRIEMELKVAGLEEMVTKLFPAVASKGADLGHLLLHRELLKLSTEHARESAGNSPSAVQHNIPAWSLFGLFFTCIPLAGSLLVERNSGIWIRLMSLPVSAGSLFIGKVIAYVSICFSQISLIVLIGFYLFPLLGLPAFTLSGNVGALVVISLFCSLAACGYGVFLGSICTSLEQAAMFGSISIVIAAALGGTLVPTYAMPGIMQRISVFSPLNWGLEAYQDVLLRGSTMFQISGDLLRLGLFFLFMFMFSWRR